MISVIVNIGLVLTPFAIKFGMDTRLPKEIALMVTALALILAGLYWGEVKRFRNIWALGFIMTMVVSMCSAPRLPEFMLAFVEGQKVSLLGVRPISGFWMAKTFLYVLTLFLAMVVIASHKWSEDEIYRAFNIVMWCGLIMAGYVFLQKLQLDQYFSITKYEKNTDILALDNPLLAGTLGQPTLCAAYLAVTVPITVFLRKYWVAGIIIASLVLLGSKMALVASTVSGIYVLLCDQGERETIIAVLISICLLFLVGNYIAKHKDNLWGIVQSESSGRTLAWQNIWEDFTTPPLKNNTKKFTITGFGPGAFEYVHSIRKNNRWWQAHNEYLEILYNHGVLGILVLILAFRRMFLIPKSILYSRLIHALEATVGCVLILGLGQFVLRIWPITLIFIFCLGLLHNEQFINQEV